MLTIRYCSRCKSRIASKESQLCYFCNAHDAIVLKDAFRICVNHAINLKR